MFKAKLNSSRHVIFHKPYVLNPLHVWLKLKKPSTSFTLFTDCWRATSLYGVRTATVLESYFPVIMLCGSAAVSNMSVCSVCVCVYVGFSGGWEEFISESLCWEYCCHNELVFTLRAGMADRIWCIVTAPFDAHLSFTCLKNNRHNKEVIIIITR